MYHPYFRGKQFELLTIRETAEALAQSNFTPIIEPVKETFNGLGRALKSVCDSNGKAIVIVNPFHGDLAQNGDGISDLLGSDFADKKGISAGILLKEDMQTEEAITLFDEHKNHAPAFIHAGFTDAKTLADQLGDRLSKTKHIFLEKNCGKLYRKHFKGSERILIRDGFRRMRNADYPSVEEFSDLHITYDEEDMNGFGDFLMVGDDFSEGGGPAYAVAIHLTFIDPEKDNAMYIYHFVSTTNNTPTDPAGKFSQALKKLIAKLETGKSHLIESAAISEFRELNKKGHFPGLGHVKKLSMKHHIETMKKFLA